MGLQKDITKLHLKLPSFLFFVIILIKMASCIKKKTNYNLRKGRKLIFFKSPFLKYVIMISSCA